VSRDGSISLMLGGEDRFFRFGLAEHERLQEALDMGVSLIVQTLHPYASATRAGFDLGRVLDARMVGDIRLDQIKAVIFNGLIGGGLPPNEAAKVVSIWVENRPVLENVMTAYAIGLAALIGPDDEEAAGEPKGARPNRSPEENSGSDAADTTRSARRPGSRRTKSAE
jgi:hypothetical protein